MLATARMWSFPPVYDDPYWLEHSAAWSVATAPYRLGLMAGEAGVRAAMLALHLLNGGLLWMVGRRWVGDVGLLVAVMLLWLHPLPLQAVFNLTWSREVWLSTLALVAVWGGFRGQWAVGVMALGAAVLVKPSAAPLVLLIPLLWARTRQQAALWVLTCGLVVSSSAGLRGSVEAAQDVAVAVWRGVALVVWPSGLSLMHDWRAVPEGVRAAALVATVAAGVMAWRSVPLRWVWLWVVGVTLPRAFVAGPPMTEAQMYLPFLAVWLALGAGAEWLLKGLHVRSREGV